MENKLSQKAKILQNKERLVISFNEQERVAAEIYVWVFLVDLT